ncbi:hypothetical protein TWF730_003888 [Orbilia blumenaviensis]|uniref:Myb-like domain-containing protein n=1 Tax=Orbilia blumenaviensis TaxID=1796055 RepID=A0AAV9U110_9PEZI
MAPLMIGANDPELPKLLENMKYLPQPAKDADGIKSLLSAAEFSYLPARVNQDTALTTYHRSTTNPQTISQVQRSRGSPRHQANKTTSKRTPRDHRPMYSQEEADAILYLRDSVGLPWKKVVELWNLHYDPVTLKRWGPRTISGLQSHYYRMLGIDKSNGRRSSAPNPDIGLLKATTRRYWWVYGDRPSIMEEVNVATQDELKLLQKQNIRRLRREAQREGRRQRKLTRRIVENPKTQLISHLPRIMHTTLEEPRCIEIEPNHANDTDSDSSLGDSFDQNSISDVDGYDTSSIAPPPSSHTSTPTSPSGGFDLEVQAPQRLSEDPKFNALPSFKSLCGVADRGNRRDIEIWRDQIKTLDRPRVYAPDELTAILPRPINIANKNPMAVASILI